MCTNNPKSNQPFMKNRPVLLAWYRSYGRNPCLSHTEFNSEGKTKKIKRGKEKTPQDNPVISEKRKEMLRSVLAFKEIQCECKSRLAPSQVGNVARPKLANEQETLVGSWINRLLLAHYITISKEFEQDKMK